MAFHSSLVSFSGVWFDSACASVRLRVAMESGERVRPPTEQHSRNLIGASEVVGRGGAGTRCRRHQVFYANISSGEDDTERDGIFEGEPLRLVRRRGGKVIGHLRRG
jgi:hypothetical protein